MYIYIYVHIHTVNAQDPQIVIGQAEYTPNTRASDASSDCIPTGFNYCLLLELREYESTFGFGHRSFYSITLRRHVNARKESARIAAEAENNMVYVALRARAHARNTCSRISRRKLRKSRFRLGGGLDGFFQVKHVLIQKQAQSLAHVAFRACQDRASVNANMYGNLMHEARSDMFWSWRRFVRVLEESHGLGMEHERNYGLGMDALVSVCSWNTNGIMVWAWMLWSPYALGTRTELWFGHGCSGQRMLLEHERNYGLGMDALVTVCSWNTNGIMVWAWMLWSAYALGTRTELWFGHGCSGQRMLLEHERNYGLGMDALVSVCSWNTNGIMVWAWMLWSAYALGTRTELWFGHGCSGQRMLLEHERNYGLGMDALVSVCSWNTNGIMVWAWMLWSAYALGTRTELWFGHGCSGHRMLLLWSEHERNYGLGMDALVTVCSRMLWSKHERNQGQRKQAP